MFIFKQTKFIVLWNYSTNNTVKRLKKSIFINNFKISWSSKFHKYMFQITQVEILKIYNFPLKKIEECVHRTLMPSLPAKVNKVIATERKKPSSLKLNLTFILWFLTLCINFKWFAWGELRSLSRSQIQELWTHYPDSNQAPSFCSDSSIPHA